MTLVLEILAGLGCGLLLVAVLRAWTGDAEDLGGVTESCRRRLAGLGR